MLTDPKAVALAAHHHDRLGPATRLDHPTELKCQRGRKRARGGGFRARPSGPAGWNRTSGEGTTGGCGCRGRSGGAGIAERVDPPLLHRLRHLLGGGKGLEAETGRRRRPLKPRPQRRWWGSHRGGGTTGSRPAAGGGQPGEAAEEHSHPHGNKTRAERAGCPTAGPFPPDRGNGQGWPAVRAQQCHP